MAGDVIIMRMKRKLAMATVVGAVTCRQAKGDGRQSTLLLQLHHCYGLRMERWILPLPVVVIGTLLHSSSGFAKSGSGDFAEGAASCGLVDAHKWLPPFGLERVGK